ncbi:MAG: insulinase family protein [Candidatus Tectomicrobia bacterium]|nr:insulinase family protein [Candidatus Tectomicrobia bacterium]
MPEGNPRKLKLGNGLTLVLLEDHATPVVALQVWVNVGSADESDDEAGISHLHEHMLFKGTAKRGVGEIAQEIEACGGEINAYTTFDHTVYHVVIASRFWKIGLDVLADAVQHSSFDPEELDREVEVVLEEIKRGDDIPSHHLTQKVFERAYTKHPYRRPIIGYQKTVKNLTRENIVNFYRRWYVPSNIMVIGVGDFDSDEMLASLEQAFESAPFAMVSQKERVEEPPQTELRSVLLKQDVQETHLNLAFHIPGIESEDIYAIDLLAIILGSGESSRLFRKIKREKELVHSISSSTFLFKECGLFMIGATLEGKKVREGIREILQEIARLSREGIQAPELEKAKINIEGEFIFQQETVEGQAEKLGFFEALWGDLSFEETYLRKISQVTAADIQKVAEKYLNSSNMTLGLLSPREEKGSLKENDLRQLVTSATQLSLPALHKAEQRGDEVTKVILDNGMTLLIKENHRVPLVAAHAALLGGLRFESRANNGICHFVSQMLTKGTRSRSALDIAVEIESIAGGLGGFSGRNSFGISSELISRHFKKGMELMADVLLNPLFAPDEIEKERSDILAAIKRQEDDAASKAFSLFAQSLFQQHPYGMEVIGRSESVSAFTREALFDFYQQYVTPENMVLAIVGDIDTKEAIDLTKRLYKEFLPHGFVAPRLPPEPEPEKIRKVGLWKEKEQAHIVLGFLGTTIDSQDRYPLLVLDALLSGQGGRLFLELRDRLGLAYAVSSVMREGLEPGAFMVYVGTSPEKVDIAVEKIKEELWKLVQEGVDSDELEKAKQYRVGIHEIRLQHNSIQAMEFAFSELYRLGYEEFSRHSQKILSVTPNDMVRVARNYFQLDRYVLSIVGSLEELKSLFAKEA